MFINAAGETHWRWDRGSLVTRLSIVLFTTKAVTAQQSACPAVRKNPNPINQVGAENRQRKCVHVSPPSLNNGHREAQAADRSLTHIWPLPDGMSLWPLKRLEGPWSSCSTSPKSPKEDDGTSGPDRSQQAWQESPRLLASRCYWSGISCLTQARSNLCEDACFTRGRID